MAPQGSKEITCIEANASAQGIHIERLGGRGWVKDEEALIEEIEAGHAYWIFVDGAQVPVLVVDLYGERYLRSDPVETSDNALLSLPAIWD